MVYGTMAVFIQHYFAFTILLEQNQNPHPHTPRRWDLKLVSFAR